MARRNRRAPGKAAVRLQAGFLRSRQLGRQGRPRTTAGRALQASKRSGHPHLRAPIGVDLKMQGAPSGVPEQHRGGLPLELQRLCVEFPSAYPSRGHTCILSVCPSVGQGYFIPSLQSLVGRPLLLDGSREEQNVLPLTLTSLDSSEGVLLAGQCMYFKYLPWAARQPRFARLGGLFHFLGWWSCPQALLIHAGWVIVVTLSCPTVYCLGSGSRQAECCRLRR